MEILRTPPQSPVRAMVFDFDGTISTLRCGWEEVMQPMLEETLRACGGAESDAEIAALAARYIDESTGIQTIFQMKWLAQQVAQRGGRALDPWDYKAEYNRRLMLRVDEKKRRLLQGAEKPAQYLMAGAADFLSALRRAGVRVYVASGTDHPDVVTEAKALQVYDLFDELLGAPPHEENCSKEAVLRRLIEKNGLSGEDVAVMGDGKVEIMLGRQAGARTIGLASDEAARRGVNPVKRARLIQAGADAICGDFLERGAILAFLGLC